jgi:hypothetical protein
MGMGSTRGGGGGGATGQRAGECDRHGESKEEVGTGW